MPESPRRKVRLRRGWSANLKENGPRVNFLIRSKAARDAARTNRRSDYAKGKYHHLRSSQLRARWAVAMTLNHPQGKILYRFSEHQREPILRLASSLTLSSSSPAYKEARRELEHILNPDPPSHGENRQASHFMDVFREFYRHVEDVETERMIKQIEKDRKKPK